MFSIGSHKFPREIKGNKIHPNHRGATRVEPDEDMFASQAVVVHKIVTVAMSLPPDDLLHAFLGLGSILLNKSEDVLELRESLNVKPFVQLIELMVQVLNNNNPQKEFIKLNESQIARGEMEELDIDFQGTVECLMDLTEHSLNKKMVADLCKKYDVTPNKKMTDVLKLLTNVLK